MQEEIQRLAGGEAPDLNTISLLSSYTQLPLHLFYEKIRESHNKKNSKLYRNIMKCQELSEDEALTCLGAYLQQALIFSTTVGEMKFEFIAQARLPECIDCLYTYMVEGDTALIRAILHQIRTDLKALQLIIKENPEVE